MNILTKELWIKKRRRKKCIIKTMVILVSILPIISVGIMIRNNMYRFAPNQTTNLTRLHHIIVEEMLLTPNEYSRPQTPLKKVNNIVVHYTGNPGSTGVANRNYFESLKTKKTTYASSHYVVGLEGEIIQALPLNEISYASNDRNFDTISIETCHPDTSGKFNDITYDALVKLVGNLLLEYNLTEDDVIRHYDVNGKKCPIYYVEHPREWDLFKEQVGSYLKSIQL